MHGQCIDPGMKIGRKVIDAQDQPILIVRCGGLIAEIFADMLLQDGYLPIPGGYLIAIDEDTGWSGRGDAQPDAVLAGRQSYLAHKVCLMAGACAYPVVRERSLIESGMCG